MNVSKVAERKSLPQQLHICHSSFWVNPRKLKELSETTCWDLEDYNWGPTLESKSCTVLHIRKKSEFLKKWSKLVILILSISTLSKCCFWIVKELSRVKYSVLTNFKRTKFEFLTIWKYVHMVQILVLIIVTWKAV